MGKSLEERMWGDTKGGRWGEKETDIKRVSKRTESDREDARETHGSEREEEREIDRFLGGQP